MLILANPSRTCGGVDLMIRTNDLTHFAHHHWFVHGTY